MVLGARNSNRRGGRFRLAACGILLKYMFRTIWYGGSDDDLSETIKGPIRTRKDAIVEASYSDLGEDGAVVSSYNRGVREILHTLWLCSCWLL